MATFIPLDTQPPPDVSIALPPWTLTAQLYLFISRTTSVSPTSTQSSANPNNTPEILQGLAPGSYHPFESIHPSALNLVDGKPQWQGGMSKIILVRYSDSPVGPYDEFILIPGAFKNPRTGRSTDRISTIYVSVPQSVWNGRRNWMSTTINFGGESHGLASGRAFIFRAEFAIWDGCRFILTDRNLHPTMYLHSQARNFIADWTQHDTDIPKHLAHFEWIPSADGSSTTVRVSHPPNTSAPLSPSSPFFSATITQSTYIPSFPINTSPALFSSFTALVQPPLLPTRYPTDSPLKLAADDNPWLQIVPVYRGWARPAYIADVHADGIGFPESSPWSVGARFEGTIEFPAASEMRDARVKED
ncbi:hypothetical protein EW146_g1973 [Bondarzewia mesenterica]|uniref:Uncharacterized protein n=1 Tax=Bondarzewia mesenterica TaxID=1095465 RepID=A0A4V3XFY1_9AGAM|nr:hypothetical protein EW146_g1973 [Bondarzewia mesenterica]